MSEALTLLEPKLGSLSHIVDCPAQTRSWSNAEHLRLIHVWNPICQLHQSSEKWHDCLRTRKI
jgi:hypothetical protein